jgi:hypothetical protein
MASQSSRFNRWKQNLRPLAWWFLLVLILFTLRLQQRLSEQTVIVFTVSLGGNPVEASALLDGRPVQNGQHLSLGSHTFVVTCPKTVPFKARFFAWYGRREFGEIRLKRSYGKLQIQANPPAPTLAIVGPEFTQTLTDCSNVTLTVPSDTYAVQVQYPHWSQTQNVVVPPDHTAGWLLTQKFGALHLTSNKEGAIYDLQLKGQPMGSGGLPAIVDALPIGEYQLTVSYHQRSASQSLAVAADTTNEAQAQFDLGALELDTTPSGAGVTAENGNYLGTTPLLLIDQPTQTAQYTLNLPNYEPVTVSATVTADETNVCSTNLVGVRYAPALQEAKSYLAAKNYSAAARAANEALAAKPNDLDALAAQEEANQHLAVELRAEEQMKLPREVFDGLCLRTPDADQFGTHEQKTTLSAKAVTEAIIKSLQTDPHKFEIVSHDSPKPDVYEITAKQTFSLGIFGGSERDCLIVVGQAKPGETEIFCKVLEFEVKSIIVANGFHLRDDKQLVAVSAANMPMNDMLQREINEGTKEAWDKIQMGIAEAQ